MHRIFSIAGSIALLAAFTALPATAQAPGSVDVAVLERACEERAPDEATRDTCLSIVRDVLAHDGALVLLPEPEPSASLDGAGVGVTQATEALLVTLLDVDWGAAIFPSEDADVLAVEFAFESTHPEAFVDLTGLVAVDEEGFAHSWGALHRAGESPHSGFLGEGRKVRGWVGFELPPRTRVVDLEYQAGSGGSRLVWRVER